MLGVRSKTVNRLRWRRFESATALCRVFQPDPLKWTAVAAPAGGKATDIARRSALC
jgi:hypothetical protein